jgi:hypothetical protein
MEVGRSVLDRRWARQAVGGTGTNLTVGGDK